VLVDGPEPFRRLTAAVTADSRGGPDHVRRGND
jgi:hypothetical protein